ncbi:hypothetical protein QYE76_024941 [Lolium multiflorum]|uniref:Reverse transcriptase Ty1/copia-type domain-containing protein n=1 Tax=Lolium multiflorum TaxID=4521 RepID=A0AAD8RH22_LOLMU|nr:hypothetical protein QYE76_024941 [Lolium multiflorum]
MNPESSGAHNDDVSLNNNNEGQGEDLNHDEDQEVSQVPILEANTRREDAMTRNLRLKSHSLKNILGDLKSNVSTRRQLANFCEHHAFVSMVEPLKVDDALGDPDWLLAMQEELNNFKRNDVWTLVRRPDHYRNVIGTKWVFKNKQDEHNIVIHNKARLVAQGFSQVEGVDYGKTFAPVARLESILYVRQPPGFEDPHFPDHVYKLNKALYGLKQAPRAWFEMSMMGELKYLLGFEIKQTRQGTFINQAKYIQDMLKLFDMKGANGIETPMHLKCQLTVDETGKSVDQKLYRSMIGTVLPPEYRSGTGKRHYRSHERMEKLESNPDYFGEALEICEEQGLVPLMTFTHDYSKEVIFQFYATMVFLEDKNEVRSLKWMTKENVMEATWENFAVGIGYQLLHNYSNFFRIHLQHKPMSKDMMINLYIPGHALCGSAYNLLPTYDIMNRIYRSTINPKHTNHDEVHGFLINLLVRTQENKGSGKQLDIMDYIWHEMIECAFLRKLPQSAPYIMRLICLKWDQANRGDLLTQCGVLTTHRVCSPQIKKHDLPRHAPKDNEEESDSDDSDYEPSSAKTKGLLAKLTSRLKKSFCFKEDLEDKMYKAHMDNKKICVTLQNPPTGNG